MVRVRGGHSSAQVSPTGIQPSSQISSCMLHVALTGRQPAGKIAVPGGFGYGCPVVSCRLIISHLPAPGWAIYREILD